jgi:hypothetical protein
LVLAGLVTVILGVGVVRAYRAREPGWNTPRGRARTLYHQMRSALAQVGLRAAENLTPSEFILVHAVPLAHYPALALALAEATRLYLRATFSVHPPDSGETGRVRRLWFRAGGDRLRLWWRAGQMRLRRARPAQKLGRPNRDHRTQP